MTVAVINALLYSPNHARGLLERALRIDALRRGAAVVRGIAAELSMWKAGLMPETAA